MRGRWWIVLAVAVLAITAQPVSAQNASAVASEHTTFGTGSQGEPSPTQLTNMSVQGTGESARVIAQFGSIVDSFDDGDLAEYDGDTGGTYASSTTASPVLDGSHSLKLSGEGFVGSTSGLNSYPGVGPAWSTRVYVANQSSAIQILFGHSSATTRADGYLLTVNAGSSELNIARTDSGSAALLDSATASVPTGEWLTVDVRHETDGTLTVSLIDSSGSTLATVSATDSTYISNGAYDYQGIAIRSFAPETDVAIDSWTSGDPASSGTYISAPHDAEQVTEGWANLTLTNNASAEVTWEEDADGDGTWTTVTSTTVSSTTNVTTDLSGTASDRWRVRLDFDTPETSSIAELHDEGLLFNATAPAADMGAAEPTGKTTSSPVTLSVPVSDSDFATSQGDSVTVDIQARPSSGSFSTIDSQTITSNQTVSTDFTPSEGGDYDYRVVLTDSYGQSTTSSTQTFSTPANLTVYRETANATKVLDADITIRFYPVGNDSGQVVTKTTTNGTVNMTGLPVDQAFVAVANVSGYESRRVFIRSLYEQQRMYLLNSSVDSAETIFEMRDYSGRFAPENTVLEIRRSINGNWTTISGDYFGASAQYPTTLEIGARYRLRLYNPETGATRSLGTYQPITAQTQSIEVSPQSGLSDRGGLPSATIRPQTRRVPAINDTQLSTALSAGENTTVDSWRVTATRNGTTIINQSYSGSTREANQTANLSGYAGDRVDVTVEATLDDGQTITAGVATLRVYEQPTNQLSLLALLTDFVGLAAPGTADALTTFLATVLTVFVMAGLSTQLAVSGETTGLVGVLSLAAFSVIGWVDYAVVFVAGVAVVGFAALRRGL